MSIILQYFIIAIIFFGAIFYIYRLFFSSKNKNNGCGKGCGCDHTKNLKNHD